MEKDGFWDELLLHDAEILERALADGDGIEVSDEDIKKSYQQLVDDLKRRGEWREK